MKKIFFILLALVLALSLSLMGCTTEGQQEEEEEEEEEFPTRPITLVCGYAAGGGSDLWTRTAAEAMQDFVDVPVNVLNVEGSGGLVAGDYVINSANPDGYTIWLIESHPMNNLAKGLEGPDMRDSSVVTLLGAMTDYSYYLFSRADSPYDTLGALVEAAEAAPGEIVIGTASLAGAYSCIAHFMQDASGAEFNIIPYGSVAPMWVELLAGRISVGVGAYSEVKPYLGEDVPLDERVQLLAMASPARVDVTPDCPTFQELGYDVEWGTYFGMAVSAETPEYIVEYLNETFYAMAHDPDFRDDLAEIGRLGYEYVTPEDLVELADYYYNKTKSLVDAGVI
ncbi:MAG: tripartite tricarboxylate transporter substrate binding protein [Chloroflexota bacterium]